MTLRNRVKRLEGMVARLGLVAPANNPAVEILRESYQALTAAIWAYDELPTAMPDHLDQRLGRLWPHAETFRNFYEHLPADLPTDGLFARESKS